MGGRRTRKECSVQRFLHVEIYRVVIMWPVITLFSHSSCWCVRSSVCLICWTRLSFLLNFLSLAFFCFFALSSTTSGNSGFQRVWGTASPLAADRSSMAMVSTAVRDFIPSSSGERVELGVDHWRACRSFAQLCVCWSVGACWAVYQAIQPSWEMQWP